MPSVKNKNQTLSFVTINDHRRNFKRRKRLCFLIFFESVAVEGFYGVIECTGVFSSDDV